MRLMVRVAQSFHLIYGQGLAHGAPFLGSSSKEKNLLSPINYKDRTAGYKETRV